MSTMQVSDIQLFNALKSKLGDAEAENLVTFVKSSIAKEITEQVPGIATKDFVDAKINAAKYQIILWAFIFWATQLGGMFAFLKLVG